MKLVSYDRRGHRRLGALHGERVIDLPDAVGHPVFPSTVEALLARSGGTVLDAARDALAREDLDHFAVRRPLLLVPVAPAGLRLFERGRTGTRTILGPGATVSWPGQAVRVDPGVAAVLGRGKRGHRILGHTLLLTWSSGEEPFASSVGPCIATDVDVDRVELTLRIDDEVRCKGSFADGASGFDELVAAVARSEELHPGDLFSSATFEPGCLPDGGFAGRGAAVELEGEGIGTLRAVVG